MLSAKLALQGLLLAFALTLAACSQNATCTTPKHAAKHLADFSAAVQEASLKNKITMTQLKEITTRIDSAGSHYSATKDFGKFCTDIDAIWKDYPL